MINIKDFENKYIIQKKHGAFEYYYVWEKDMWNKMFKGKIALIDAISTSNNIKIPFFAMPESKRKNTFLDTIKINESIGIETTDQKSLFVQAKEFGRRVPFSWNENTPNYIIESKKLLNRVLGFENSQNNFNEKTSFETWYENLI